ncbi:DUF3006 domain-containing protein [Numidum massiliense]|uniref:DUF3006 domain-containing protein n=1 Tax=Numidum massiliense TaxID=1522315 RepID=UPI0006D53833|nr:DUF3006 domain-containing protein [Numidum massiliense]
MRKGVIDRFEGNFAVVEWLDNADTVDVHKSELPAYTDSGDVVFRKNGNWHVDKDETAKREKAIEKLMEEMWED